MSQRPVLERICVCTVLIVFQTFGWYYIIMKDDRIMGIKIQKGQEKIVILNVYLPYCSDDNFDDFFNYLVKLDNLIKDCLLHPMSTYY